MTATTIFENLTCDFVFYLVNKFGIKKINLKNFNAIRIFSNGYSLLKMNYVGLESEEEIIMFDYFFEDYEDAAKKFIELQEAK